MANLSDARFDALRALLYTGSTSDMLFDWLVFNGAATAKTIPDAWQEMLVSKGIPVTTGIYHRNDAWFDLLGSLGYVGSLNDRELKFWQDGGTFPP